MLKNSISVALATVALLAFGQSSPAPSFEAASIKPSDVGPGSSGINTGSGLLRAHNVTLRRCIQGAYGLPESQIIGGPKWMDELRFEIVAKADHPAGDGELSLMLQSLLAERFKLALHRDTQTRAGYALTVAKGGVKATPSDPAAPATTNRSRGMLEAKGLPIPRLATKLSDVLGVPVVDLTGDSRSFDFTLKWVPDEMTTKPGDQSGVPEGPSLFTALQEQLGLKLEGRKVPVDVVVVDGAELPSEN
jgi:uncharacterized protein (TIGR03435 family)